MMEFLSLLLSLILGNILGFLFSLVPGFHPNLISNFLKSDLISLAIAISVSTSYNFAQALLVSLGYRNYEFIFSSGDSKKIVKEGIKFGIIFSLIFPLFIILKSSKILKPIISTLLIIFSIHFIRKDSFPIVSLVFFIISGIFGCLVLLFNLCRNPLTPMLTGLFGIPSLFFGKEKVEREYSYSFLPIFVASVFLSILPGISPVISSVIASDIFGKSPDDILGPLNFVQPIVSIYSWYFTGKSREGVFEGVLRNFEKNINIIFLSIVFYLFSMFFSYFLFSKIKIKEFERVKLAILPISLAIIFTSSGVEGVLVFIASILFSVEIWKRKKEQYLIGSIVVPTLLWYL